MRKFFALLVLLTTAGVAGAQSGTLRWTDELCEMTGTYDPAKYTEAQLRNTLLLLGPATPSFKIDAPVWKYEDIAKLDLAALERDFEAATKRVRELDIVKVPFFEKLRQDRLTELKHMYDLARTTTLAYSAPEAIDDYPRASDCKLKFAAPLKAGGESLVAAWREVNLASQKRNADPQRLQRRFDAENASPDRLKFALVETMAFGWWNCAVESIERPEGASNGTADREFRKLFRRVKQVCDEP